MFVAVELAFHLLNLSFAAWVSGYHSPFLAVFLLVLAILRVRTLRAFQWRLLVSGVSASLVIGLLPVILAALVYIFLFDRANANSRGNSPFADVDQAILSSVSAIRGTFSIQQSLNDAISRKASHDRAPLVRIEQTKESSPPNDEAWHMGFRRGNRGNRMGELYAYYDRQNDYHPPS